MPLVQRAIHRKVLGVIARLKSGGVDAARSYLLTDLGNPQMAKVIKDLYRTVGLKHAQINYIRIKEETAGRKWYHFGLQTKGFGFNQQWADFILNYLNRFLTSKITFEIAQTTRDALIRALSIMVTEGLSVDGMIERLQDWPYERYQAARIVRTEVNRAANVGASAQASTSEFQQMKEWISVVDNRTRGIRPQDHASHIGLNGTVVNEDDVFTDPRNNDRLEFPGDPNAKAESVINCRCAVGYTVKRDANGNPIPKRRSTVVLYPERRPRPKPITI